MPLMHRTIASNDVRVPTPQRGEAIVISRYGTQTAALITTDDLAEMEEARDLLGGIGQLSAQPLSALALEAKAIEESPSSPIEDRDTLLGLLADATDG